MAQTPIQLFRAGNATSARLDIVRPSDVTFFMNSGVEYVRGRQGGMSSFEAPAPGLGGKWWELPLGSLYDDSLLHLVKKAVDEGDDDHWMWEPDHDMPRSQYVAALALVNGRFNLIP